MVFQFHKGTIRTEEEGLSPFDFTNFNSIKVRLERFLGFGDAHIHLFQFHKGTIRTAFGHCNMDARANFNSIKVRLEQ